MDMKAILSASRMVEFIIVAKFISINFDFFSVLTNRKNNDTKYRKIKTIKIGLSIDGSLNSTRLDL